MKILVISTGEELLRGQFTDTNSGWIAARLNEVGASLHRVVVVGDDLEQLISVFTESFAAYDLVICTGGLGPTDDDLTAQAVSMATGQALCKNDVAEKQVRACFARIGRSMNAVNLRQSELPQNAEVLKNPIGTAPGFSVTVGSCVGVFLPGVPLEMKAMVPMHVLPLLPVSPPEFQKIFMCYGIGESSVQAALSPVIQKWPQLRFSYRAAFPENCVSVYGTSKAAIEQSAVEIAAILKDKLFADQRIRLPEALGKTLAAKGYSLSTAESCTGGLIAHEITQIPGSSAYFKGSAVCYDNEMKISLLNVHRALIVDHGAVSEQVVRAMAIGAQKKMNTDFALATSGIAGPGGGTPEKPVGTVHMAVAHPGGVVHRVCHYNRYDRQRVKVAAAWEVMHMAFELLGENK